MAEQSNIRDQENNDKISEYNCVENSHLSLTPFQKFNYRSD